MENKEKVINLVRKILAKTQNNNEHEIEVAMLKAQEVMMKYNLSMSDIDEDIPVKEVVEENITEREMNLWWVSKLGLIVADNFRCTCIKRKIYRKSVLSFLGLKEDVAIAKEIFVFARESLDYFAQCYVVRLCDEINLTPIRERPEHQRKMFTVKDFVDDKNDYSATRC